MTKNIAVVIKGEPLSNLLLPKEALTGTPLDDYMELLPLLGIFAQGLRQFDPDGKDLCRHEKNFEKIFLPGEEGGVPDSYYMSWLFFDLRFGDTRRTICERLLDSPQIMQLHEPGPTLLKRMSRSYCAFYEIKRIEGDFFILEELGTEREWRASRRPDAYIEDALPGQIMYVRLIGPADGAYLFTTPYFFRPGEKNSIDRALGLQIQLFMERRPESKGPREFLFVESSKEFLPEWLTMFLKGGGNDPERGEADGPLERRRISRKKKKFPKIYNSDGDPVSFTEVWFRIQEDRDWDIALAMHPEFEYSDKSNSWTWLQKRRQAAPFQGKTVLAVLRKEGKFLIAETNSVERALHLRDLISHDMSKYFYFSKMRSRVMDALPKPSPEELIKWENEHRELNSRPEVKAFLKKQKENYYYRDWLTTRIPLLSHMTPLEAMNTEEGRNRLLRLLEEFEKRQAAEPDYAPRVDFDIVRRKLGLPSRVQS